jgi:voltage-gated potassium channel
MVTTTTVGYGDVSPVTPEGRVIAVGLMLTGIGVIGIFTATVASCFFEQASETAEMERRLARLEAKVDYLVAAMDRQESASSSTIAAPGGSPSRQGGTPP